MDINEMRRLYREKKAHEEVSSASSNVEDTAHITQLEEGKNSKPTKSGDSSTVSLSEIACDYEKRVYQDENEVNKLSISDDSITVVRNQEENIFVFFVNGEVFSGTLWSSDERFEIEIKESEVTFCRCYHKNGFLAIAQNLDDDSNSFYFDDQDNAMDRDAFEKKYGKEFEEIITAGFAELESRIEENTSHDNSTAYSGDSSHLYRNEESLSESHYDSSTANETDYSVAEDELQFSIDKVREENGYTVVEGCLNSGSICTDYEVDIVRHNGERIRATIAKIATKEINMDSVSSFVKGLAGDREYKYEYTSYMSYDDEGAYDVALYLTGVDADDISFGDKIEEPIDDEEEYDGPIEEQHPTNDISSSEQDYLNELKEILADGEFSARERRLLDKIRVQLGISEARAKELEESLCPKLTSEEQEYFDEYKEIIAEGEISARDQRFLEKLKKANGISDERAKEIEALA